MIAPSAPARLAAATIPAPIARLPARQLARHELARSIYQPSIWLHIENTINGWLARLFGFAGPRYPDWWLLIALLIAVVLIIAAIRVWVRPARRRSRAGAGAVLAGAPRTADDHRRAAERLAADGDYASAIVERVRAIAVQLDASGILPPRPGRTATELAAEAAVALPASAAGLHAAARLFDDVRYGGRPGTLAGYRQVRDLDAAVKTARTVSEAAR